MPSTSKTNYGLKGESANFIALQKRYIKSFLAAYYRFNDQISMHLTGMSGESEPK